VEIVPTNSAARAGRRGAGFICLAIAVVGISAVAAAGQAPAAATKAATPPTVLFMCPHGAAKSVLASAYFKRAAKERGLNVQVISAGTEPDPQVAPVVASHLKQNGYEVPVATPHRVTADDMAAADVVVSIGCDLKGLPAPRGKLVTWDDVPAPSEDFAAADRRIRERVLALVEELIKGVRP
jgi:arsenate reductase (thioredoxin)